jgi:hypothetical protein
VHVWRKRRDMHSLVDEQQQQQQQQENDIYLRELLKIHSSIETFSKVQFSFCVHVDVFFTSCNQPTQIHGNERDGCTGCNAMHIHSLLRNMHSLHRSSLSSFILSITIEMRSKEESAQAQYSDSSSSSSTHKMQFNYR